jgi:hypothetical protein
MIYPTIYIGGESRFELPAALSDFSDDLTLGWVNEVLEGAAIVLQRMDFVPIPDEKLETFWYVDAATGAFTVAWRILCRPESLPH